MSNIIWGELTNMVITRVKEKITKKDKKFIGILIILALVLQWILEDGQRIMFLLLSVYEFHKYCKNTKNTTPYIDYEFLDEEKYNKGLRNFIIFIDVYAVLRIISIIVIKQHGYSLVEIFVLMILFISYEKYLAKKYVSNLKRIKLKNKSIFINNKVLTPILLIIFLGITSVFVKSITKIEGKYSIKFGNYEYNLTYDKNNRKIVEVKLGSTYKKTKETDKNSKYLDEHIINYKKLITKKVFKFYSIIATIILFILVIFDGNSKYGRKNELSIVGNACLMLVILFTLIILDDNTHRLEYNLTTNFYEYLNN